VTDNRLSVHNGSLIMDELVMENASVHIERLDDGLVWMSINNGVTSVYLNFYRDGKHVRVKYGAYLPDGTYHENVGTADGKERDGYIHIDLPGKPKSKRHSKRKPA